MGPRMEYYSIQFKYAAAPRGFGSLANDGVHVQLSVNEDVESKLLTHVERVAYNAAKAVGLKLHHQYSWPDGSCWKWATAETDEEFRAKFERMRRILASPWMSVRVSPKEDHVFDPAAYHGGCHLNLADRIAGKPMLYLDDTFVPQEPRTSWGGMTPADWVRYREHRAFEDGFKEAFGHEVNFWHGGPEGYAPSIRAQELAGVGYCLGRLFKLLNY